MQRSITPLHKYSGYSTAKSDLGLVPAAELARKIKKQNPGIVKCGLLIGSCPHQTRETQRTVSFLSCLR